MKIYTDVLIIGSGIAALQLAQQLATQKKVTILTKSTVTASSSFKAQGGIAAVIANSDSLTSHIEDTLKAGVHHQHYPHVEILITEGAKYVKNLIANGFTVDRDSQQNIALGLEGAHSHARIVHAQGDATGKVLTTHLAQQVMPQITLYEHTRAYELLINTDGHCIGAKAWHQSETYYFMAQHTVIASGGVGGLYHTTSNLANNIGDGITLAYLAGAAISDMEFIQFHPSLLHKNNVAKGLVSEAVRGAGGFFVDSNNEAFMANLHPLKDLAPRHITAHALYQKQQEGLQTFIDISKIANFAQRFPTISKLCSDNDIAIVDNKIPVMPGSHFLMGGIVTDSHGATSIANLYAVGEVACTGVHGANRLASNSLLEGITFGTRLAQYLLQQSATQHNFTTSSKIAKTLGELPYSEQQLRVAMMNYVGIIRYGTQLAHFKATLPSLQQLQHYAITAQNTSLLFMHINAVLITTAALMRKESRGAHMRLDYTTSKESWQNKWLIFKHNTIEVRNYLYESH